MFNPKINPNVTTIIIENNVVKTPTAVAEELTEALMRSFIVVTEQADPHIADRALAYRVELERMFFKTAYPIVRRFETALRNSLRKET